MRPAHALLLNSILTIKELKAKTEKEILNFPNLGRGSLSVLNSALEESGFGRLREEKGKNIYSDSKYKVIDDEVRYRVLKTTIYEMLDGIKLHINLHTNVYRTLVDVLLTVKDLLKKSPNDLLSIPSFTMNSLYYIQYALAKMNLGRLQPNEVGI